MGVLVIRGGYTNGAIDYLGWIYLCFSNDPELNPVS